MSRFLKLEGKRSNIKVLAWCKFHVDLNFEIHTTEKNMYRMARRLDPKFSEKNLLSEKNISIRKKYFASEKTWIFFLNIFFSIERPRYKSF